MRFLRGLQILILYVGWITKFDIVCKGFTNIANCKKNTNIDIVCWEGVRGVKNVHICNGVKFFSICKCVTNFDIFSRRGVTNVDILFNGVTNIAICKGVTNFYILCRNGT